MCTVSWASRADGYDLFFNRDELVSRAAEHPPARRERDGVVCLAPRDGQHGGTWLGVNEFGLTICLLNDYASPWQPAANAARFSRGHIVLHCLAAATHRDVMRLVQAQPLDRTPAFQLLALSPDEGPLALHWRGSELKPATLPLPLLSSSSFATEDVIARRRARFAALATAGCPDAAALAAFHREHRHDEGAYSVLMRRSDATTRSITHVTVNARAVRLHYQPVRWAQRGPALLAPTTAALERRSRATLAA